MNDCLVGGEEDRNLAMRKKHCYTHDHRRRAVAGVRPSVVLQCMTEPGKKSYSTLGGKTDKLEKAVNRELNVTKS